MSREEAIDMLEVYIFTDESLYDVFELREGLDVLKEQPHPSTWQPIETAPKDNNTYVTVWAKRYLPTTAWYSTTTNRWVTGHLKQIGFTPTDWQPLPPPPQPNASNEQPQPQAGGCEGVTPKPQEKPTGCDYPYCDCGRTCLGLFPAEEKSHLEITADITKIRDRVNSLFNNSYDDTHSNIDESLANVQKHLTGFDTNKLIASIIDAEQESPLEFGFVDIDEEPLDNGGIVVSSEEEAKDYECIYKGEVRRTNHEAYTREEGGWHCRQCGLVMDPNHNPKKYRMQESQQGECNHPTCYPDITCSLGYADKSECNSTGRGGLI